MHRLWKIRRLHHGESGVSLIEAAIAVAILGIVIAFVFGSLSMIARADLLISQRSHAENLAQSQLEYLKSQDYIPYTPGHSEYTLLTPTENYTFTLTVTPIDPATGSALPSGQDNGSQKIVVSVSHYGATVLALEGYKVNR
ncbi:MAG: type II secretion system protein [Chloroflexota bacterium]